MGLWQCMPFVNGNIVLFICHTCTYNIWQSQNLLTQHDSSLGWGESYGHLAITKPFFLGWGGLFIYDLKPYRQSK